MIGVGCRVADCHAVAPPLVWLRTVQGGGRAGDDWAALPGPDRSTNSYESAYGRSIRYGFANVEFRDRQPHR